MMGHLTLRCVHCGEASEHHLNDGKAPADHIHRFTVAVEWEVIDWPNPSSQYIKFAKGHRVTRLRCESCNEEVRRA
jgi:hypothetical protein